jgi:hypothetical protein
MAKYTQWNSDGTKKLPHFDPFLTARELMLPVTAPMQNADEYDDEYDPGRFYNHMRTLDCLQIPIMLDAFYGKPKSVPTHRPIHYTSLIRKPYLKRRPWWKFIFGRKDK